MFKFSSCCEVLKGPFVAVMPTWAAVPNSKYFSFHSVFIRFLLTSGDAK